MSKPVINVVVGVLYDQQGQFLLAQRPADKSWAGWWEFPGGKIEAGESGFDALVREFKEELDITVNQATPWLRFTHHYSEQRVNLYWFKIHDWQGTPKSMEQQTLAWHSPDSAANLDQVLAASVQPIRWLGLSPYYAVTPQAPAVPLTLLQSNLEHLREVGVTLVQFRHGDWPTGPQCPELYARFQATLSHCRQLGITLLVNSIHPKSWWQEADGVQLRAADAVQCEARPLSTDKWVSVSAHHLADILYAQVIEADFIVLGHVKPSPSHPLDTPLGWSAFSDLAAEAGRPVYAIGGLRPEDLAEAKQHHAHGIAGISAFWLAKTF